MAGDFACIRCHDWLVHPLLLAETKVIWLFYNILNVFFLNMEHDFFK
jgi:hypothetical protein